MQHCTLAVECMSVVFSGMGVSSAGWFLHRIGISIINSTICLVREIQTIIQILPLPRFAFALYFLYKTKHGIYYIHMKQIYGLEMSSLYINILGYETDIFLKSILLYLQTSNISSVSN